MKIKNFTQNTFYCGNIFCLYEVIFLKDLNE